MNKATNTMTSATATDCALALKSSRKVFGDVVAVDGIDLDVGRGECFGLLGPNGAGRMPTINCEGLTAADAGDVLLAAGAGEIMEELRQRIGVQLQ